MCWVVLYSMSDLDPWQRWKPTSSEDFSPVQLTSSQQSPVCPGCDLSWSGSCFFFLDRASPLTVSSSSGHTIKTRTCWSGLRVTHVIFSVTAGFSTSQWFRLLSHWILNWLKPEDVLQARHVCVHVCWSTQQLLLLLLFCCTVSFPRPALQPCCSPSAPDEVTSPGSCSVFGVSFACFRRNEAHDICICSFSSFCCCSLVCFHSSPRSV